MTPAAFLVVFCAAMAAIAIGRLAVDRDRDPVDVGTALLVAGIALLALLWVVLAESWLGTAGRIALGIGGAVVVAAGVAVIVRSWNGGADGPERGLDCGES